MASTSDPGNTEKPAGNETAGKPAAPAEGAGSAQQATEASKPEAPAPAGSIPPRPPFPPIPLFIVPAISSISPPGAVVGTAQLMLSVFGSNFNTHSTVQWNQAALPTTFISSTQLNAAVSADNLATVGQASITVSNPAVGRTPSVVSNAVTFSVIPDISAIISQLQANSQNSPVLLAELQSYVTVKQGQIDALTGQVSTDQSTIAGLNSQIASQQTTITQQQNQIVTLTAQLAAQQAQSATPLAVAQSFKSVVDTIQQNAQAAGGIQSTVTNMNVQIKSLVNLQTASDGSNPQATLVFPSPTALPDPAHLSTISLSFASIPGLQRPSIPAAQTPGAAPTPPQAAAPATTPASAAPASAPAAPPMARAITTPRASASAPPPPPPGGPGSKPAKPARSSKGR